ncbi:glycosyl hydrolase family 95 catalytic domain-containing protein [Arthrobacter sp. 35W]|uniref:glycosyl hydrolase family 95 catalytic domain-containing protein n=1 Tax=Arthrobacter sp. 35W TaxID=1132441 RepID=UPI0003F50755|nr:hypothetical protein [Arthrobacter sp. 35W]
MTHQSHDTRTLQQSLTMPANLPPKSADNLRLAAPITSWDDAIPLGNGLMGGLLWGGGNTLRLSLDRGDLWDERTTGEAEWWKKNPWQDLQDEADPWGKYYGGLTPTKLPAGRLELALDPGQSIESFELDLATAEGTAALGGGSACTAFFSAAAPVAMLRLPGAVAPAARLVPAGTDMAGSDVDTHAGGAVAALGCPPAVCGAEAGMQWYVQDAADGFSYCVCVAAQHSELETLLAVAITTSADCAPGEDLLDLAQSRCSAALAMGYENMLANHVAWWHGFWAQSAVEVPEAHIQRSYQFTRYLYGAGSRTGAPPMPLQGVWTADNGGLPPWKGDYHNDLNTQLTYSAYQASGDFDSGASYLDLLWKLAPQFRDFARDFYGTHGLASPGVMSLAGQPLGGWSQYSMSPTMSAWNAHLFYLHWRYTGDDQFLADRAYPWCSEVGRCMAELLTENGDGVLVLAKSSSPEIFDNRPEAWLKPNSNYDLMCLKMLFLALAEMADAQDLAAEADRWASLAARLGDFHTAVDGELLLDADTPLRKSHRHLSHLMGIHPFNLITVDGGDEDRKRIVASLAAWEELGTGQWTGYSWSWMACLRARVGDGEQAFRHLNVFTRAFVSRNGFHVNGDQSGRGFSDFTYRPFTLEGNFAAMQAVQEMLLQSWSPTPGRHGSEVIRVFAAMPEHWHNAGFSDLRVEGGHRVSARWEGNATTELTVVAGRDGVVRIRDNFDGREPEWSLPEVVKVGANFEVRLSAGQAVAATFAVPVG